MIVMVFSLLACGPSEQVFFDEIRVELCEKHASCNDALSVETCLDHVPGRDIAECDYDPAAALACREEIASSACLVPDGQWYGTYESPEACEQVYDCS